MPLTWNINQVENWEELADDQHEQVVTQTIVFSTIATGIATITEKNWKEAYARFNMIEKLDGPWVRKAGGDPYPLQPEDWQRRIGLTTNANFTDETRASWRKRTIDRILDDTVRFVKVPVTN